MPGTSNSKITITNNNYSNSSSSIALGALEITPLVRNFSSGGSSSSRYSKGGGVGGDNTKERSTTMTTTTMTASTNNGRQQQQKNQSTTKSNSYRTKQSLGQLKVVVLSVYDLALREPPNCVTISACHETISTGPPIQRHKDRNSFKFAGSSSSSNTTNTTVVSSNSSVISTSSNMTNIIRSSASTGTSSQQQQQQQPSTAPIPSSNEVSIHAPLPELYKETVQIQLVYSATKSDYNLITEYPLNQLNINEPMWLILRFEKQQQQNQQQQQSRSAPVAATPPSTSISWNVPQNDNDDDDDIVPPTIRVQMTLSGPYRPEIEAIVKLGSIWFQMVDTIEHQLYQMIHSITIIPSSIVQKVITTMIPNNNNTNKQLLYIVLDMKYYILLLAVPIIAILLVSAPILIGISVAILPILLPIISLVLVLLIGIGIIGFILYCSSSTGRTVIGTNIIKPAMTTFLSSKAGQKVVYETGPRPTILHVTRAIIPGHHNMMGRLLISLGIDFIGSTSYLIPVLGELTDIVWAPFQTILIMALYDDTTSGNTGSQQLSHLKYLSFMEEILPFTDIIPTATIGWFQQYGVPFIMNKLMNLTNNNNNSITTTTARYKI
jgi:hypothetical protein